MRKSVIEREVFKGRRVCQRESFEGDKCHARATVSLTITSFPPCYTLTSTSLLCEAHADRIVGAYEREWNLYPERFEN